MKRNRAKEKCLKEIFGANNKMHFWPGKREFFVSYQCKEKSGSFQEQR
jgi:hypothetical protein